MSASKVLDKLPPTVRDFWQCAVLGHEEDGKTRQWQRQYVDRRQTALRLEQEAPDVRRKLFAVLFTKLEDSVEAAWQFLDRLPYQVGNARKAFRAPGRRAYQANRAAALLEGLSSGINGFEQEVTWWAAWAGHHAHYDVADTMGVVFAATIDADGKSGNEVFDIPVRLLQKRARHRMHGAPRNPRSPGLRSAGGLGADGKNPTCSSTARRLAANNPGKRR